VVIIGIQYFSEFTIFPLHLRAILSFFRGSAVVVERLAMRPRG